MVKLQKWGKKQKLILFINTETQVNTNKQYF